MAVLDTFGYKWLKWLWEDSDAWVAFQTLLLTRQMAGEEYPPLSCVKVKSERVAADQDGRDF